MEFVARAAETSETHALEAVVGLEVGKAHLDPFSLITGFFELGRVLERARIVASIFVYVACHFAHRHVRTALRLQRAGTAIERAGSIVPGVGFGHPTEVARVSMSLQALARRTGKSVGACVEDEVMAVKSAVVGTWTLPHWDMRRDAGAYEPAKEVARSIRRIGRKPNGLQVKSFFSPFDHCLRGCYLVVGTSRCRFDINDDVDVWEGMALTLLKSKREPTL